MTVKYPKTAETLKVSRIYTQWWYYSVELLPGVITRGQYEDTFPFLPRTILRNCQLSDMECLDLGSMEGLIPISDGAKRSTKSFSDGRCRSLQGQNGSRSTLLRAIV